METYARDIGVTAGQLRRLCQTILGQSPFEVITPRIVHAAQRDLAYSILSMQQIAESLGFVEAVYFSRFYCKQTRRPPSESRKRVRRHQPLPAADARADSH